ncbi:unnamed protein product [Rotaria socialis]
MIARVATKTTNFFHDEHRDEENSHHKRSINSISPGTPIKTTITTNPINHNILINTCQSLKKMKIDLNRCTAEENNREKLNQLGEIVGESEVRALISFFSNPFNMPQIQHTHNLHNILLPHARAHPLEPFTGQCPICDSILTSDNARTKQVSIYTNNGQVLPEMDLCLGSTNVITPRDIDEFDFWAWSEYPRLISRLIYLWCNHKTLIGPCNMQSNKCSSCFTIDGHQKARRRVCRTKQVDYMSSDFTEPLAIGCWRTPTRHSLYCELHQTDKKSAEKSTNNRKTTSYKLRNSRTWK